MGLPGIACLARTKSKLVWAVLSLSRSAAATSAGLSTASPEGASLESQPLSSSALKSIGASAPIPSGKLFMYLVP